MAEEQTYLLSLNELSDFNSKCVEECASDIEKLDISIDSVSISELSLVDMISENGESIWLEAEFSTSEAMENEWLKGELDLTGVICEKNSLINKLDNLARSSGSRSPSNDERSLISSPILPSDYLISQPVSSTPAPKSPRSKISNVEVLSSQSLYENDGNTTITSDQPLNSTFNKEIANSTFNQEASPPTGNGLNSTFSKDEGKNLNSTYSKEGNATFNQTKNMNATFDLSQEKINSRADTFEQIEEMTTETESQLKTRSHIKCDEISEKSVTLDSFNDSNDINSHTSNPASPGGRPQSKIQVKSGSILGADNIQAQLPKTRLPPPSRLQAPSHLRYQAPVRSKLHTSTLLIPRGANAPVPASSSGKSRSGLRHPTSIPRNTLKPPTEIPRTGLRLPAQIPSNNMKQPTIPQVNKLKLLKPTSNVRQPCNSRSPAPMVENELRKPSGIVRPSFLAKPSGLVRPSVRVIPAGSRPGKTVAKSDNDASVQTGSGVACRLVTG